MGRTMDKKRKAVLFIVVINVLLMIITTIIIYTNLSKPYLVDETSFSTTIIDFYNTAIYWLALPALSCVVMVASIRYKWLCILSGFLSFAFVIVVAFGPSTIAVFDAITEPWIGTSGYTVGSGYIILERLAFISIALCVIRFIIAIFQYKMNKKVAIV